MVSFTSSAEFVRLPTSGKNCDSRCLISGSASIGANDSVFMAVDKSTELKKIANSNKYWKTKKH